MRLKICENCHASYAYRLRKCPASFCGGTVWRHPTCEEMSAFQQEREENNAMFDALMEELLA
jgi:hypothetical protein